MSGWIIAAVIIGVAALVVWWRVPQWQANLLSSKISDPKALADVEDNWRKTIGQLIGGAAVLIGAGIAYYQSQLANQATHDQLISQQVSRGFEQLGNDNLVIRLGGIYTLEGVMETSEQYHRPVLEALSAFVRLNTKTAVPTTDIQAVLTVIGQRKPDQEFVDLNNANLSGADLGYADLSGADLSNANLSQAFLLGAHLSCADLSGVNLSYADLRVVSLNSTELNGAALQGQLNKACGDEHTKLDEGLKIKKCPPLPLSAPLWPHRR